MMMFWNIRRRPSRAVEILRSMVLIGAAVSVPVGFEVLRRWILRGRPLSRVGRKLAAGAEAAERVLSTNGHGRRRRRMTATGRS